MGLAEALLDEFALNVTRLVLVPSHGGVFEVAVDDELIFSKKKKGHHPTIKEIKEIVRRRLED